VARTYTVRRACRESLHRRRHQPDHGHVASQEIPLTAVVAKAVVGVWRETSRTTRCS